MAIIKEHYVPVPSPLDYVEVDLQNDHILPLSEAKRLVETYISTGAGVRFRNGSWGWEANVPRGIYLLANQGEKLQAIVLLRAFAAKVYLDSATHGNQEGE
jgi:hypothetical protein